MGRILLVVGLLLLLVGVAGAIASSLSLTGFALAPSGAALCQPGETLAEETGPSTYRPRAGSSRSVRMICVDEKGTRRDATGDFVQGLFGQVLGDLGNIGNFIASVAFSMLATLGTILAIIGAILTRRRNGRLQTSAAGVTIAGQTFGPASPQAAGALAERLRQIADARGRNLITQEEHDRLRAEIMQSMRQGL